MLNTAPLGLLGRHRVFYVRRPAGVCVSLYPGGAFFWTLELAAGTGVISKESERPELCVD